MYSCWELYDLCPNQCYSGVVRLVHIVHILHVLQLKALLEKMELLRANLPLPPDVHSTAQRWLDGILLMHTRRKEEIANTSFRFSPLLLLLPPSLLQKWRKNFLFIFINEGKIFTPFLKKLRKNFYFLDSFFFLPTLLPWSFWIHEKLLSFSLQKWIFSEKTPFLYHISSANFHSSSLKISRPFC